MVNDNSSTKQIKMKPQIFPSQLMMRSHLFGAGKWLHIVIFESVAGAGNNERILSWRE